MTVLRLAGSFVAIVAVIFAMSTTVAFPGHTSADGLHLHTSDDNHHAVTATHTTIERDPPAVYDDAATANGAVDPGPNGSLARPDGTTSGSSTAYHRARTRSARATAVAERPVEINKSYSTWTSQMGLDSSNNGRQILSRARLGPD